MARIPYFDPDQAVGPRAKKTYEKLPRWNVFKMAGHLGETIEGFSKLGNQILNFTKIDPILREIAIIRTGVLSGAAYEVHQHKRYGRKLGMSEALLKAMDDGPDSPVLDDLQRKVMRFTDDVVKNVRASDATFRPLADVLSHQELAELVVTIGYYMMVSRYLETFDVEIEGTEKASA